MTFRIAQEMMTWIEEMLKSGLFWPKYHQIAAGEIGGAMDNNSLVSWDEYYLIGSRSGDERS